MIAGYQLVTLFEPLAVYVQHEQTGVASRHASLPDEWCDLPKRRRLQLKWRLWATLIAEVEVKLSV